MWILPKQLITSRFVVDTKGLEWDYEQYSQLCEKSLLSKSRVTASQTWFKRLKTISYMKHLCIRTLKPSHSQSFEDAWTSYLVASHANPFQMQDKEDQQTIADTSSQTSSKELPTANQQLSFWRTSKESSQVKQEEESLFCNMSSTVWKEWVTQQRQEYLVREKLVRVTYAKEFSSWPTPTVFDVTGGRYPTQLVKGNWRSKHSKDPESPWYGAKLRDAVETYAKCPGHLNPTWVEWLMGVPTGWTELGCWETV